MFRRPRQTRTTPMNLNNPPFIFKKRRFAFELGHEFGRYLFYVFKGRVFFHSVSYHSSQKEWRFFKPLLCLRTPVTPEPLKEASLAERSIAMVDSKELSTHTRRFPCILSPIGWARCLALGSIFVDYETAAVFYYPGEHNLGFFYLFVFLF